LKKAPSPPAGRIDRKLLVFHHGALGDFIVTLPALTRLKTRYSHIHLAAGEAIIRLGEYLAVIDGGTAAESAVLSPLYGDPAFLFSAECGRKPSIHRFLAGFADVLVFSFTETLSDAVGEITGRRPYRVPPRPEPAAMVPVGEYLLCKIAETGLISDASAPNRPKRKPGNGKTPERLVIHPGSGSPRKNWPLPRFLELAGMFAETGGSPAFLLGPAERKGYDALEGAGHPVFRPETPFELVDVLKNAKRFVGNDAGVTHLAAYLELSVTAIFGPSSPVRWAPAGATVIRAAPDCPPCFETRKTNCDTPRCLTETTAEAVFSAVCRR
jgi:ADP-heptose:LPS heptosyltransferase